eukprot:TRINITY_DN8291_c0_g1_i1.p1 TRINITY_DN8291_c0_g1~~TRINITY_DN8291_c0_g1_i1.p1  ORF type:complete len:325 (-),score=40.56 TRINITY_DN8291_c0_g1_i1:313-1287(-)
MASSTQSFGPMCFRLAVAHILVLSWFQVGAFMLDRMVGKSTSWSSVRAYVAEANNVCKRHLHIDAEKTQNQSRPALGHNTIHVIACVWKRKNTRTFLEKLSASNVPGHLHVHICNNNAGRQTALESIARDVVLQRKSGTVAIDIVDMGGNVGGFARFLLAKRVSESTPGGVDYFIMVDDDQYVRETTLAEVYAKREPRKYKSWHGKNWNPNETNYWKTRERTLANVQKALQNTNVTTYQYGGTGMSIIDASIFRVRELYQIPKRFLFIEDLWLSYIVQLMGWPIERLFVFFDDAAEDGATAQWSNLRDLKNRMFAKLNYMRCSK